MPAYTFYIYSSDVLSYNSGTGEFDFDAGYDYTEDRYRIEVSDDDSVMDASGDANQLATIYDMDGNVVDSGTIFTPMYAELEGGAFYLDRIEINGTHYGYTPSAPLTPGNSYTVTDSDTDSLNHTYFQSNSVPCFGPSTLIDTPTGPRQITQLRAGDLVMTYDNGPQPILWAGHRRVSRLQAFGDVHLRPGQIDGTLRGLDQPFIPLTLSANHRLMFEDPVAELHFGSHQVFVASKFVTTPVMPAADVHWHHFLLPQHEVVRANGVWVESLYSGDLLSTLVAADHLADIRSALGHRPHTQLARPDLRSHEAAVLLVHLRAQGPVTNRNIRVA